MITVAPYTSFGRQEEPVVAKLQTPAEPPGIVRRCKLPGRGLGTAMSGCPQTARRAEVTTVVLALERLELRPPHILVDAATVTSTRSSPRMTRAGAPHKMGQAVHAGSMHMPLENNRTTKYEILVRGTLAADFASDIGARCWPSVGKTIIVVDILDQSHLHGILDRLGDLNVEIESVNRI
jgi:hypothetical protein